MTNHGVQAEVQRAADVLIGAFARSDREAYFDCFAEDATFLFHTTPGRLDSRAEYERLWDQWIVDDGFRVVSCESSFPAVQVISPAGDTAVFSHRVRTVVETRAGRETVTERETIVFVRDATQWRAVHEHLSPDPALEGVVDGAIVTE